MKVAILTSQERVEKFTDWSLVPKDTELIYIGQTYTDDSINEIYVKDNEQSESKSIVIKPFNQPFMEIDMLFLKRHD